MTEKIFFSERHSLRVIFFQNWTEGPGLTPGRTINQLTLTPYNHPMVGHELRRQYSKWCKLHNKIIWPCDICLISKSIILLILGSNKIGYIWNIRLQQVLSQTNFSFTANICTYVYVKQRKMRKQHCCTHLSGKSWFCEKKQCTNYRKVCKNVWFNLPKLILYHGV